jgi:signal transduction histidine kinase
MLSQMPSRKKLAVSRLEGDMAQMYAFPEQSGYPGQLILLAERIRIAQELHDTLLQGLIGASMQLQVALENLPMDSAVKPPLTRVLQLLKQTGEAGRNAVLGLRSSSSENSQIQRPWHWGQCHKVSFSLNRRSTPQQSVE